MKLADRIAALIKFILEMLGTLWRAGCVLVNLFARGEVTGAPQGPDCCITPPEEMRPRPDPYIYSQFWLYLRGLAFTWDNPDFTLIDSTGKPADRMKLQPGENYRVVVRVHNGSLLAAIETTVILDVLEFGAGGIVEKILGSIPIDIPAFGSAEAGFNWTAPSSGGHNCLRAFLIHPDDGNPLNNIGQHNTQVMKPTSPTHRSTFVVRNDAPGAREFRLEFDSYRLPSQPMRSRSLEERDSVEYLQALRASNNRKRFPVSAALDARIQIGDEPARPISDLNSPTFELAAGGAVSVALQAQQPPAGGSAHVINVHAFDGPTLVGGVTLYVDPEA
jgi:hypothetical protein